MAAASDHLHLPSATRGAVLLALVLAAAALLLARCWRESTQRGQPPPPRRKMSRKEKRIAASRRRRRRRGAAHQVEGGGEGTDGDEQSQRSYGWVGTSPRERSVPLAAAPSPPPPSCLRANHIARVRWGVLGCGSGREKFSGCYGLSASALAPRGIVLVRRHLHSACWLRQQRLRGSCLLIGQHCSCRSWLGGGGSRVTLGTDADAAACGRSTPTTCAAVSVSRGPASRSSAARWPAGRERAGCSGRSRCTPTTAPAHRPSATPGWRGCSRATVSRRMTRERGVDASLSTPAPVRRA
jgi:hypothetical protein